MYGLAERQAQCSPLAPRGWLTPKMPRQSRAACSNRAMDVHEPLRRDSIGSMASTYRKRPCRCGHGFTIHRPEPGRTDRPRAICYHPGCKCKNYRPAAGAPAKS